MITDKQVIERLREYHAEFKPKLDLLEVALKTEKPNIAHLAEISSDLSDPMLDFMDLIANVQSAKRKLGAKK